ncbi:RBM26 [Bugula neritina]|uniref:RBM26 n=1 Tax=Bugula neritina TaxID=10212 RepID=A0A7J7K989_BUGNE|nr:RBM26 [Bugula neritina]
MPVVMTDVTTLNFNSSSTSQPLAPVNPSSAILPNQQPVPPRPPIVEPYNPELPRMWGPNPAIRPGMHPRGSNYMMTQPRPMGGFTGMPPHALHPGPMRMGSMGPRPHQMYRPRYSANNGQPRPGTSHPPIRDPNRATLEIRNLPVEFNKIVTLHQHFEKFGTIHNIQVQYNGCPTTALVTFSANEEAKQAHQNPNLSSTTDSLKSSGTMKVVRIVISLANR